ncbi:MAG TPA: DUF1569 domain-containing protein [Bacteroidia bacterium]|jgi:hypothetical protein|nr:DUF1569 domain-containing protein [Bacteroidia bacterium]HMU19637.1 DUF1569 domain-containing protein [Bacteroidia bacterium]
MSSLFNRQDNERIVARVEAVQSEKKAIWGTMSAEQMLLHCQQPFKVVFEELRLKRSLVAILFGGLVKKSALGDEPFKANLPTVTEFKTNHLTPEFETEKKNLIACIQKFQSAGPECVRQQPHPFFGKMTDKEWDKLMYKHLDHHLRQFSA